MTFDDEPLEFASDQIEHLYGFDEFAESPEIEQILDNISSVVVALRGWAAGWQSWRVEVYEVERDGYVHPVDQCELTGAVLRDKKESAA